MRHDAVHLEPHKVSRESRQQRSYFPSAHRHSMMRFWSLDVAEVTKALPEGVERVPERRGRGGAQDAEPGHRPCLLRLGGERRGEQTCAQRCGGRRGGQSLRSPDGSGVRSLDARMHDAAGAEEHAGRRS